MNSVSVTGKKWIFKDFETSDIDYLKDNFFLDDLTAKLIMRMNRLRPFLNFVPRVFHVVK